MSQTDKAGYWRALKEFGVEFEEHYREYTTEQLSSLYAEMTGSVEPPPAAEEPLDADLHEENVRLRAELREYQKSQKQPPPEIPHASFADPDELPAQRLNTQAPDEPIRVDSAGRVWYQEEVQKPGYAKPRGRRVLKYLDTGVVTKQVQNGDYLESFEVGGAAQIPGEVKITLPSYQVGIYVDPRFKGFKIITYGGLQGFDLFDIQSYYGGSELVPESIKRIYVSNVLCYDIRTTIREIEWEFRRQQLDNKKGLMA